MLFIYQPLEQRLTPLALGGAFLDAALSGDHFWIADFSHQTPCHRALSLFSAEWKTISTQYLIGKSRLESYVL